MSSRVYVILKIVSEERHKGATVVKTLDVIGDREEALRRFSGLVDSQEGRRITDSTASASSPDARRRTVKRAFFQVDPSKSNRYVKQRVLLALESHSIID